MKKWVSLIKKYSNAIVLLFCIITWSCTIWLNEPEDVKAQAPVLTAISNDITTNQNKAVTLSVTAEVTDNGTLSYQWYSAIDKLSDGIALEQKTDFEFSPAVTNVGNTYYYCIITNTLKSDKKSITSPRILVTVIPSINAQAPVIATQPVNVSGELNQDFTFTVSAVSKDEGELTYQWYYSSDNGGNATAIQAATSESYSAKISNTNTGYYYCIVTNTIEDNGDGGIKAVSVKSAAVTLQVVDFTDTLSDLVITKQPVKMNIAPSDTKSVSLEFGAEFESGYKIPINYQWYETPDETVESGQEVNGGEGSKAATFTIPAFTERGIKYFYCIASTALTKYDGTQITKSVVSDVVSVAYTGLPTLYLNTEVPTTSITKNEYFLGNLKIISDQYDTLEYTFAKTDKSDGKAKEGIKGRGNSSWSQPKKGYNIKFDSKESVLGMPAAKKWCIVANYSDKTLLRNKYASYLGNEIFNKEWNPHFEFIDLIFNGEYWGNYIICEKNTISEDRIDIQDITDCTEKKIQKGDYVDKNGDNVIDLNDGGFLIEIDLRHDADYYFTSTKGVVFTLKDPDEVTEGTFEHIKNLVQEAEDALYAEDFTDNLDNDVTLSKWMKYCDIDSFIDWYFVNEIGKNRDANFVLSVYMYYNPEDEKLHLGPNWDFDPAFGNDGENGNLLSLQTPTDWRIKTSKWISRMFEDQRFVEKVKFRWNEKKASVQESFSETGAIQNFADEINISAIYNFKKWQILGQYVWPNPQGAENRTTYQSEVDYMKNWLSERYLWLDTEINNLYQ